MDTLLPNRNPATLHAPPEHKTRVTKTLKASQPGTVKLCRIYGDALLCVRYRESLDRTMRYTTVELVVDTAQVKPKPVAVVLPKGNADLRRIAMKLGSHWDPIARVWWMSREAADLLSLTPRGENPRRAK